MSKVGLVSTPGKDLFQEVPDLGFVVLVDKMQVVELAKCLVRLLRHSNSKRAGDELAVVPVHVILASSNTFQRLSDVFDPRLRCHCLTDLVLIEIITIVPPGAEGALLDSKQSVLLTGDSTDCLELKNIIP